MWTYLSFGAVLGLSAGFSPGPLLALVISQTLRHGAREGVRVAMTPLITDLPIIGLGVLAIASLPDPRLALGLLSFAGSLFVAWLGLSSLRQQAPRLAPPAARPRSYLQGALVNALSPHPWLFWFSVGAPTIVKAWAQSAAGALGFVIAFYCLIVGAKVAVALLVGRSRRFLEGRAYTLILRALGILLLVFAVILLRDGLSLTGVISSVP